MKKCHNSVIPIDNINFSVSDNCNDRFRNITVSSDVVCTCPHPLLSVRHVCDKCWDSILIAVEQCTDEIFRMPIDWVSREVDLFPGPLSAHPKIKRSPTKYTRPFCFFNIVKRASKWPSVVFSNRLKPHFKNFVRHIWEKISRYHFLLV